VAINGYAQNASFVQILEAETQEADLLVASHPYLFNAFVQANLPVWYDAHNVEYDLKASMLESDAASDKLLKMVREVEEACVQASEMVLACSDQDLQRFGVLYDLPRERTRIVPNGVDVRTIAFTPIRKRRERKKKLGFSDTITLCLFVGSGHRPNEEGLAHILDMARELKKVVFLVVGTVCHAPCLKEPPANVKPLGVISETEKTVLLQSVDLGINPIVSGSGTNLKLLEYAAAGIPVLSTSFGARGTGLGEDELFVARPGEFCHAFERFRQTPEDEIDARVRRARAAMERGFSWQSIGERLQTLFTARFLS
jgi:glycosyltransferase involved in cell wall biosynthesis